MTPEKIREFEGKSVNVNTPHSDYSVRAVVHKGKCYYIDDSARTVLSGQIGLYLINPNKIRDIKEYQNSSDLAKFVQRTINENSDKLENGLHLRIMKKSWTGHLS